MKTYHANSYRDSFAVMETALNRAGYARAEKSGRADFVFVDHEPRRNPEKWERFNLQAQKKPIFIYPHTPYFFLAWDGDICPSPYICCHFVVGEAGVRCMQAFGYPCRVEAVGLTRPCEVKPFTPTPGKHLIYTSVHLTADGKWIYPPDLILHERAMEWIRNNRDAFERVTVYYTYDMDRAALRPLEGYDITFVNVGRDNQEVSRLNTATALKQLEGADFVISCDTFGYLAASQGIPTVLIGHDAEFFRDTGNYSESYTEYSKYFSFPLSLFDLCPEQVAELCKAPNPEIETWKRMNIGPSFQEEKFLEIVREYL